MNSENEHKSFREERMRLVSLASAPLAFVLLVGCAHHDLRCDAHLAPINPPAPPATPADLKPPEEASP